MKGVLIASCVLASLLVVSQAASIKFQKVALIAKAGCSGAGEPFPNPDDCGSFLQCEASGVAAVKQCPAGLEFNARLKVCDWPDRAGCSTASGSDEDSSSSSEDGDDSSSSSSSSSEEDERVAKVNAKVKSLIPAKKPKAIALHA